MAKHKNPRIPKDVESLSLGDEALSLDAPLSLDNEKPEDPFAHLGPPTGDNEKDCLDEFNALGSAFAKRAGREQERFWAATDSEYWACLVFQSREAKEAFLEALNWLQHGDKYIDGHLLAEKLGIALPDGGPRFVKEKPDRKLDEISRPLD